MQSSTSYSKPNSKKGAIVFGIAVLALGATTVAVLQGQGMFSSAFRPNVVGRVVQTCEISADGASELSVPAVYSNNDYRLYFGDVSLTTGESVASAIGKVKKKGDLCAGMTLYRVSDYGTSSALHYAELTAIYGKKIAASYLLALLPGDMAGGVSAPSDIKPAPTARLGAIMAVAYKWKFDRTPKALWPATYAAIMTRLHTKSSLILGTETFASLMPAKDVTSQFQSDAISFKTQDRYISTLRLSYESIQSKILANGIRPLVPPAPREARIEPIITRLVKSKNGTPYVILFFYSYTSDSEKPQYIGIATSSSIDKPVFKRTTNVLSVDSPVANIIDVRYSVAENRKSATLALIGSAYDGTGGVKYARFSQAQLNATKIPLKYLESPETYKLSLITGISYCNFSTKSKTCSWTTDAAKATQLLESTKEMFIDYNVKSNQDRISTVTNIAVLAKDGTLSARSAVNNGMFGVWSLPVRLSSPKSMEVAYTGIQRIFGSLLLPKLSVTFKFLGGKEVAGVSKVYLNTVQINDPVPTKIIPTPDQTIMVADPAAEAEVVVPTEEEPTTLVDTIAPMEAVEPIL